MKKNRPTRRLRLVPAGFHPQLVMALAKDHTPEELRRLVQDFAHPRDRKQILLVLDSAPPAYAARPMRLFLPTPHRRR